MSRLQPVLLALAGLAGLGGIALFLTSPGQVADRNRAAALEEALEPVASPRPVQSGLAVETRTVRAAPVQRTAEVAAVLSPVRHVTLAAEVEGRVVAVRAEEHGSVEAEQVLVQLEEGFLSAAERRASGRLQRARANHELAQLDLARQVKLTERRVTSRADLDRAESAERANGAEVREAAASLRDARLRLAKTKIRAPFAGVVERFDIEPGAYVRPGDRIADVLDLSAIEVEVGLTDREIVAIQVGQPVVVRVDVFADAEFRGKVTGVASAPDVDTQKYEVEVQVPNEERRLLPGMLGRVRFESGEERPAIRIPRRAAQNEFEISYVFVVVEIDGLQIVQRRRVSTRPVPFRPDLLEVVGGLRDGERVAVSRVRELRDGLVVQATGTPL